MMRYAKRAGRHRASHEYFPCNPNYIVLPADFLRATPRHHDREINHQMMNQRNSSALINPTFVRSEERYREKRQSHDCLSAAWE